VLTVIHITHEAVHKIGGIGSVLEGLITSKRYGAAVSRTLLVGPLFSTEGGIEARFGRDAEVYYSSLDGRFDHSAAVALRDVEHRHGVQLVYGRRPLKAADSSNQAAAEALLINVSHVDPGPLRLCKFRLFEAFGIRSDRYENIWEYEQYMRLALPALDALRALGAFETRGRTVVVAHEFMGVPTALAARAFPDYPSRTVFYAHEVAAVRKIVEEHPGGDAAFYNIMRRARRDGRYLEEIFGSQDGYFKHPLVKAARFCDNILAVGDDVVEEFRFLAPEFAQAPITLTYNGIPAHPSTSREEVESKRRLQQYAENLLGFKPDYVFTHVTRLVPSKGLWRDLDLLAHVEQAFRRDGRTAVLFVLSTEIGGPRRPADILRMEREWDWPVAHREGLPDLSNGEAAYYRHVQSFNARSRQCKVVFLNQFGFDRACCGQRMPEAMEFWDIRRGSDLEFGQSIYEPFGIAQIEAMAAGCVCVISSVCGCAGFVRRVTNERPEPNVLIADFTELPPGLLGGRESPPIDALRAMTAEQLRAVEAVVAQRVAERVLATLPKSEEEYATLLERGQSLATRMSWDVIAQDYFLPAIEAALSRPRG